MSNTIVAQSNNSTLDDYPSDADIHKDWNYYDRLRWGIILPISCALLFVGCGPCFSLHNIQTYLNTHNMYHKWSSNLSSVISIIKFVCFAIGFLLFPLVNPNTPLSRRLVISLVLSIVANVFFTVSTSRYSLSSGLFVFSAIFQSLGCAILLHSIYAYAISWFPDIASVVSSILFAALITSYYFFSAVLPGFYRIFGLPFSFFFLLVVQTTCLHSLRAFLKPTPAFLPTFIHAVLLAASPDAPSEASTPPNSTSLSAVSEVDDYSRNALHLPRLFSSLKVTARLPTAIRKLRGWKDYIRKGRKRRGYGVLTTSEETSRIRDIEMGVAAAFDNDELDDDLDDITTVSDGHNTRITSSSSSSVNSAPMPQHNKHHRESDDEGDDSDIVSFAIEDEDDEIIDELTNNNNNHKFKSIKPSSSPSNNTNNTNNFTTSNSDSPQISPRKPGWALAQVVSPMDKYTSLPTEDLVAQPQIRYLLSLSFLAPLFGFVILTASPDIFDHVVNPGKKSIENLHASLLVALSLSVTLVGILSQLVGHRILHKIALLLQLVCLATWDLCLKSSTWTLINIFTIVVCAGVHISLVLPMTVKYLYIENTQVATSLSLVATILSLVVAPLYTLLIRDKPVDNHYPPSSGIKINAHIYDWLTRLTVIGVIVAFVCVHKLRQLPMDERHTV